MAEVADIFRELTGRLDFLSGQEQKVIAAITSCRTEVLGGNAFVCDDCAHLEVHYNSCRNRHCPKCQSLARLAWVSDRLQEILPVPYFHAVFTIPDELKQIALYNKKAIYNLLFRSVHKTLSVVAKREENLGVSPGGISVLHTWDQKLNFHPHIHCILPGGGLGPDRTFWKSSSDTFFLSVKKLSRVFRGIFLRRLETLYTSGVLHFGGAISHLKDPRAFRHALRQSCRHDWVVYLKAPFSGPEKVFQYLGKYTHRVGISNQRIVSFSNGAVVFSYLDRKDNNTRKLLTLSAHVFATRFLLHVLPPGFVKIRYFGFLANCVRAQRLPVCKQLIERDFGHGEQILPCTYEVTALADAYRRRDYPCPRCGKPMRLLMTIMRTPLPRPKTQAAAVARESG
jgi:hypothetical protein